MFVCKCCKAGTLVSDKVNNAKLNNGMEVLLERVDT